VLGLGTTVAAVYYLRTKGGCGCGRNLVALAIGFVSAAVAAAALMALVRVRRQRRILERCPWIRTRCRVTRVVRGRTSVYVAILFPPSGPSHYALFVLDVRDRVRSSGILKATTLDVAGDPATYAVVRRPSSGPLLSVRGPWFGRTPTWWQDAS
jgi:hypothetical protein